MAVDVNKLIITEVAQITAFNNAGELEFSVKRSSNAHSISCFAKNF